MNSLDQLAVFRRPTIGKPKHRLAHVGLLFVRLGFKRPHEAVYGDSDRGGLGVQRRVNDAGAAAKRRCGSLAGGAHADKAKQRWAQAVLPVSCSSRLPSSRTLTTPKRVFKLFS